MRKWLQCNSVIWIGFVLMLFVCTSAVAQSNPVDPALISKEQKEIVKLQDRLLKSRERLSGLYKDQDKYIKDRDQRQVDAQKAADRNADAAVKFSDDAGDKSKAKKARRHAKRAASEAKSARKATDRVDKTDRRIRSVEKDIKKDEDRLATLQAKVGVVQ